MIQDHVIQAPLKACAAAPAKGQRGDKWLSDYQDTISKTREEIASKNKDYLDSLFNTQKFSTNLMGNMAEHLSRSPLPVTISTGLTSPEGRNGAADFIILDLTPEGE